MAKFASLTLYVREVDNGFVAKGTMSTEGDEYGAYGGESVEYIATDLEKVGEYATKALEGFKVRLDERHLNADNGGAQQNNRVGNGRALPGGGIAN